MTTGVVGGTDGIYERCFRQPDAAEAHSLLNWAQTGERPSCSSGSTTCMLSGSFPMSSHTAHMLLARVNLPDRLFCLTSRDMTGVIVTSFVSPSALTAATLRSGFSINDRYWSKLQNEISSTNLPEWNQMLPFKIFNLTWGRKCLQPISNSCTWWRKKILLYITLLFLLFRYFVIE